MDLHAFSPRDAVYSHVVNDRQHGALLRIAAAYCTTCTLLFLLARLWIRWPWHSLFGKDDVVAVVATLISIIQVIVTVAAVYAGLGRMQADMSSATFSRAASLTYASGLLYIITIFTSKAIVSMLLQRLSSSIDAPRFALGITLASIVLGTVSFLAVAVHSTSTHWLTDPSNHRSLLARWIVVEAFSVIIDIAVVVFSAVLVWKLQMPRNKKLTVVGAFAARLFVIPVVILRLNAMAHTLQPSRTPLLLYNWSTIEIYTQAEMCYNLLSATIPCLRIFMRAARSGMLGGLVLEEGGVEYYSSRGATAGGSRSRSYGKKRAVGYSGSGQDGGGGGSSGIELGSFPARGLGESEAKIGAGTASDKASLGSDSSRRAIIVKQTVDVQFDDGLDERGRGRDN